MSKPMKTALLTLLGGALVFASAIGCQGIGEPPPKKVEEEEQAVFKEIDMQLEAQDVIVLAYRNIVDKYTPDVDPLDVTLFDLEDQLASLMAHGATVISIDRLYDHLAKGKAIPSKSVVITFEDGCQSVLDKAVPILNKNQIPFTVFVRSDLTTASDAVMRLQPSDIAELSKSKLCTIGSATVSRPESLILSSFADQKTELADSRIAIEKTIGKPVRYLSWPNGFRDQMSAGLAIEAGYFMALTQDRGVASLSSSIMEVRRWTADRFKSALDDLDAKDGAMPGYVEYDITPGLITSDTRKYGMIEMATIVGGKPQTVLIEGRESVGNIINQYSASAGINGGFFLVADIKSADNRMIGPCLPGNTGKMMPDQDPIRLAKITGRPMVMFAGSKIVFAPFRPAMMNDLASVKTRVEGVTDVFMSGAWLVHKGKAMTEEQMQGVCVQDAFDFRRRAFIGVTRDGQVLLGAALGSFKSDQVATAAVKAGCVEAVLLDSGFSTSLVIGQKILASGHSSKNEPSRPVPHAILLTGQVSEADQKYLSPAEPEGEEEAEPTLTEPR